MAALNILEGQGVTKYTKALATKQKQKKALATKKINVNFVRGGGQLLGGRGRRGFSDLNIVYTQTCTHRLQGSGSESKWSGQQGARDNGFEYLYTIESILNRREDHHQFRLIIVTKGSREAAIQCSRERPIVAVSENKLVAGPKNLCLVPWA